mmetsp:Transcript_34271/g.80861  ORF Transcript_34271/g.80861 Transcript_34271/m.80861 type:complete len:711 (-) Transcript_34271:65-2197(-)
MGRNDPAPNLRELVPALLLGPPVLVLLLLHLELGIGGEPLRGQLGHAACGLLLVTQQLLARLLLARLRRHLRRAGRVRGPFALFPLLFALAVPAAVRPPLALFLGQGGLGVLGRGGVLCGGRLGSVALLVFGGHGGVVRGVRSLHPPERDFLVEFPVGGVEQLLVPQAEGARLHLAVAEARRDLTREEVLVLQPVVLVQHRAHVRPHAARLGDAVGHLLDLVLESALCHLLLRLLLLRLVAEHVRGVPLLLVPLLVRVAVLRLGACNHLGEGRVLRRLGVVLVVEHGAHLRVPLGRVEVLVHVELPRVRAARDLLDLLEAAQDLVSLEGLEPLQLVLLLLELLRLAHSARLLRPLAQLLLRVAAHRVSHSARIGRHAIGALLLKAEVHLALKVRLAVVEGLVVALLPLVTVRRELARGGRAPAGARGRPWPVDEGARPPAARVALVVALARALVGRAPQLLGHVLAQEALVLRQFGVGVVQVAAQRDALVDGLGLVVGQLLAQPPGVLLLLAHFLVCSAHTRGEQVVAVALLLPVEGGEEGLLEAALLLDVRHRLIVVVVLRRRAARGSLLFACDSLIVLVAVRVSAAQHVLGDRRLLLGGRFGDRGLLLGQLVEEVLARVADRRVARADCIDRAEYLDVDLACELLAVVVLLDARLRVVRVVLERRVAVLLAQPVELLLALPVFEPVRVVLVDAERRLRGRVLVPQVGH